MFGPSWSTQISFGASSFEVAVPGREFFAGVDSPALALRTFDDNG
jgi:hypothetical protein